MKMPIVIAIVGISMFVFGLIAFYSIELGQTDPVLRFLKNTGTFVGISGMGVALAGSLLYFINKNEPKLKEHSES
jgi:hypothetical protein